jgi:hypothetical protein
LRIKLRKAHVAETTPAGENVRSAGHGHRVAGDAPRLRGSPSKSAVARWLGSLSAPAEPLFGHALSNHTKASGASFASRLPAATFPGLAWTNLPEFPSGSSGFHPAQALGGAKDSVLSAASSRFRSGSPLSPVLTKHRCQTRANFVRIQTLCTSRSALLTIGPISG